MSHCSKLQSGRLRDELCFTVIILFAQVYYITCMPSLHRKIKPTQRKGFPFPGLYSSLRELIPTPRSLRFNRILPYRWEQVICLPSANPSTSSCCKNNKCILAFFLAAALRTQWCNFSYSKRWKRRRTHHTVICLADDFQKVVLCRMTFGILSFASFWKTADAVRSLLPIPTKHTLLAILVVDLAAPERSQPWVSVTGCCSCWCYYAFLLALLEANWEG